MISFEPTDDERAIVDEVRRFAEKELRPRAREAEAARAAPAALLESYRALGLHALDWPEEAGGAGLSIVARALVEEELSRGDPGLAVALDACGVAAAAVLELAPAGRRAELLRRLADAPGGAALALAEEDLASELGGAIATTLSGGGPLEAPGARRGPGAADADGGARLRLDGRKRFVLHAPSASLLLVVAREGGGAPASGAAGLSGGAPLAAALVPREASGISLGRDEERIGLRAARSAEVRFERVAVAEDAVLASGEALAAGFDRLLSRLWITTAARQVGVARAALEYATFYAQDRQAFGKKIGQFQGIAFKVSDVAIAVDAARWLAWRAASLHAKGDPAAPRAAALALAQANEAALQATVDTVQVLGGAGFVEDYPVEKWMRDARALASLHGGDPLRHAFAAERAYGPGHDAIAGPPAAEPADALSAMAAFGAAFGGGGGGA
jgi:hypothetical protein